MDFKGKALLLSFVVFLLAGITRVNSGVPASYRETQLEKPSGRSKLWEFECKHTLALYISCVFKSSHKPANARNNLSLTYKRIILYA